MAGNRPERARRTARPLGYLRRRSTSRGVNSFVFTPHDLHENYLGQQDMVVLAELAEMAEICGRNGQKLTILNFSPND